MRSDRRTFADWSRTEESPPGRLKDPGLIRDARCRPSSPSDRISSASTCPARTIAFEPSERTREHHALSRSRDDRRSDSTLRQIQAVRPDVRPDRAHPIRRARTDLGWSSHVGRVSSRGQRAREGRRPPFAHAHTTQIETRSGKVDPADSRPAVLTPRSERHGHDSIRATALSMKRECRQTSSRQNARASSCSAQVTQASPDRSAHRTERAQSL